MVPPDATAFLAGQRDLIVVFTAVHGAYELAKRACDAIAQIAPSPVLHLIGDDFSPEPDASKFRELAGPFEQACGAEGLREVYHCSMFGVGEGPNLGTSLAYAFRVAREYEAEALWVVESDVIPRAGIVEAFREAQEAHGARTGAVAPLYTEVGEDGITTFGGMLGPDGDPRGGFLGLKSGTPVGSWEDERPRIATLEWAHLACLWIPRITLEQRSVEPAPAFTLYYQDHDLTIQIQRNAKLDVIVTSRAVAEHTREDFSIGVRWPDPADRQVVLEEAHKLLQTKWKQ